LCKLRKKITPVIVASVVFCFKGNNGVGFRTVKVFSKNTLEEEDFLKNLLDLDCPSITRKHLCPKNKNDRKRDGRSQKTMWNDLQKETMKKNAGVSVDKNE